ncbi:MAG: YetF domain-containing protein [Kofleriaceae bacterium]
MFEVDGTKLLEIVIRVTVVYVACMVLLRVSGRREMSELGPMDLLTMLLLSETISPALTGGEDSIPSGLVAAGMLMLLSVLTSWLAFRSKRLDKILQGDAVLLVKDGKVNAAVLRKFRITDEDFRASLHQAGVMAASEVSRAFVEADGEITVIKRKDFEEANERLHQESLNRQAGSRSDPT